MKLNNTWINHEDEVFVRFTCALTLPKDTYLDIIFALNKVFHRLTYTYELLMTLSPEYCEHYDINYFDHYFDFLEKRKKVPNFFPIGGYEFYENKPSRISKIFYKDQSGKLISSYVHNIGNGPNGIPRVLLNDRNIRKELDKQQYYYADSPLLIERPVFVMESDNAKFVSVSFNIVSHCSFWLDITPNFKYFDVDNNLQLLEFSDNRAIAYANTPRLNSFFRDVRIAVEVYDADCWLYDSKGLLSFNYENIQKDGEERMGLKLDNEIIYQEDIEEGRVNLPFLS